MRAKAAECLAARPELTIDSDVIRYSGVLQFFLQNAAMLDLIGFRQEVLRLVQP